MQWLLYSSVVALSLFSGLGAQRNPIRRVVLMLQEMQKKIEGEQEKEEGMFDKFMCYCTTNKGELSEVIEAAMTRIPQLESQINELTGMKQQVAEELVQHKADREAAVSTVQQATKLRAKERADYEQESGETGRNIDALRKAVQAITNGMGSTFLQAEGAQMLRKVVMSVSRISDVDRRIVTDFLSGTVGYGPRSGEINGILKQLADDMEKDLGVIVQKEDEAKVAFAELKSAKDKEIAATTAAIETKTQRNGELAVKIVETKDDLTDSQQSLSEDQKFQVNLRRTCDTKEKDWAARQAVRRDEVAAIHETIKILNDDDALDLFKKTLPSPRVGAALVQMTNHQIREQRALRVLKQTTDTYRNAIVDFIAFSLKGKNVDFGKVIAMVDDMVKLLKQEQVDDDAHKDYCAKEFDTTEDKENQTRREIDSLRHEKEVAEGESKNLKAAISTLQEGIQQLDKQVTEATESRKKEHQEYVVSLADNNAALELLKFAKERLNKFYNPKLSQHGEKQGTSFLQRSRRAAPGPPPEVFDEYKKKGSDSTGVIAMIDMLANDLKKDIQEAEHDEKDAQEEYEEIMADSAAKRAMDSKAITNKQLALAQADEQVERAAAGFKQESQALESVREYAANLHRSCDFLVDNYAFRKAARAEERDSLNKAKSVLHGADFSL
eukprot:GEMP01009727.1.p1 GENE.GEMP01009727.1~~GEMP01009727.1.p1  ORF type:complete len:668 (+),score=206.70 GEMP01009727.1:128-2131(+)